MSIPTEVTNQYNQLKNQYSQIFKRYIELQEERRENALVLTNITPLKGENRRCWKVIGGVLVEQTIVQTTESLKSTVTMLQQALKALDEQMGKRQKQVMELELKYNLNPNNKQAELVK